LVISALGGPARADIREHSFAARKERAGVRFADRGREAKVVDELRDCATSNVNANIRGRSRTTAHVSGGLNISGHQGRRGNFLRMRQPQ